MSRNAAPRKPTTPKQPQPAIQLAEILGTSDPVQQVDVVRSLVGQLQVAAQPPTVLIVTGNLLTGQVSVSCPNNDPVEGQLALLNQASLSLLRQTMEVKAKQAEADQKDGQQAETEAKPGDDQAAATGVTTKLSSTS